MTEYPAGRCRLCGRRYDQPDAIGCPECRPAVYPAPVWTCSACLVPNLTTTNTCSRCGIQRGASPETPCVYCGKPQAFLNACICQECGEARGWKPKVRVDELGIAAEDLQTVEALLEIGNSVGLALKIIRRLRLRVVAERNRVVARDIAGDHEGTNDG